MHNPIAARAKNKQKNEHKQLDFIDLTKGEKRIGIAKNKNGTTLRYFFVYSSLSWTRTTITPWNLPDVLPLTNAPMWIETLWVQARTCLSLLCTLSSRVCVCVCLLYYSRVENVFFRYYNPFKMARVERKRDAWIDFTHKLQPQVAKYRRWRIKKTRGSKQ